MHALLTGDREVGIGIAQPFPDDRELAVVETRNATQQPFNLRDLRDFRMDEMEMYWASQYPDRSIDQ